MMKAKRVLGLAIGGVLLGAVYFGLAAAAMATNELVWVQQLGSKSPDLAYGVATDAAGNIYLTGETEGSLGGANHGNVDAWVAKYDAAGHVLWKHQPGTEGYDSASGIATDAAGNVYLTGVTSGSFGGAYRGEFDAWVAKYDAAGGSLWKRQLGTEGYDSASGVATDAAGNLYLTGVTSGSHEAWVAKYDAAGRVLWKRQLGTAYVDAPHGIAADAAGNIYLTGETEGSLGGANRGRLDAWVAKYDATGHVLWKRQLGTETEDIARGVATDAAGNAYLTGVTAGALAGANRGYNDAWVAKYDAGGRVLWKRQLGTESDDFALGVATDGAENVYLTGHTYGALGGATRGGYDAWVAKYDAAGNALWKRQLGTESSDFALGIATDGAENVYLTGYTYGALGGANRGSADAWVARYSIQQ